MSRLMIRARKKCGADREESVSFCRIDVSQASIPRDASAGLRQGIALYREDDNMISFCIVMHGGDLNEAKGGAPT